MRVALFPADDTGCGRYRAFAPALAVQAAGDAEVRFGVIRASFDRNGGRVAKLPEWLVAEADVAVLQRPCNAELVATIPHLQRLGLAVVVELDDDLAALHPNHPGFAHLHPSNPRTNWHHLKRACRLADLVTVTTPALAARYGGAKARVLPNCVPSGMLSITGDPDGSTVGWGGTTQTHIGDLCVTRGGVAVALEETGARFLVIGPSDGVKRDLSLAREPDSTGRLSYEEYLSALAQLDVGIVPLTSSAFNAAKSGLKLLEYSALGVAAVASPTPDNQRLHDEGLGLLAKDRARDWSRQITRLIRDPPARAELGARAREIVAERWTYELNAWRWAEAWAEAIDRRRQTRKVAA